jgi:prephenate dehydrogenase
MGSPTNIAEGKTICIIGISGEMGRWFARFFAERGWTVNGFTRDATKAEQFSKEFEGTNVRATCAMEDCIPGADWVMISVPIPAHREIIDQVAPLLRKDAVLFDIASVKGSIPAQLVAARESLGIHVLSTHPMFGPGAESMKDKNFILIDLEGDHMVFDAFRAIIEPDEPKIIEATVDEHDAMIAYTLGIPHFLNILFGKIFHDQAVDIQKLLPFGGTTFHLQHLISQEVLSQEPYIYATIELENDAFGALLKKISGKFNELAIIVENKDYDRFISEFTSIRDYYADAAEFKSAMPRFNAAARLSLEMMREYAERDE